MAIKHIYPVDRAIVRRRVNHAITEQARFSARPATQIAIKHALDLSAHGYVSEKELTQILTRSAGFKARKLKSSGVEGVVTSFTAPDGDKIAIKFNREPSAGSSVDKHNRANLISAGLGLGSVPIIRAGQFEIMPFIPGKTGNEDKAKILARLAQNDAKLARLIVDAGVNDQIALFPDGHPGNLMFLLTRANNPQVTLFDRKTSFGKPTGERKLPHNTIFQEAVRVLGPEGTSQAISEGMQTGLIVVREFPEALGSTFSRQAMEGVTSVPSGIVPIAARDTGLPSDWQQYLSADDIAEIQRMLVPVRAAGVRYVNQKIVRIGVW